MCVCVCCTTQKHKVTKYECEGVLGDANIALVSMKKFTNDSFDLQISRALTASVIPGVLCTPNLLWFALEMEQCTMNQIIHVQSMASAKCKSSPQPVKTSEATDLYATHSGQAIWIYIDLPVLQHPPIYVSIEHCRKA